ncbi:hypothetical protein [Nocardia salmonicida]|uniref:hypothetical protein n=1 Tax=Nocardia salmonicida TaxID=53431 RepID=UPI003645E08E
MTGHELIAAYQAGKSSADDPRARNPHAPAPAGSEQERLAQMWMRGRLSDVPDFSSDT